MSRELLSARSFKCLIVSYFASSSVQQKYLGAERGVMCMKSSLKIGSNDIAVPRSFAENNQLET